MSDSIVAKCGWVPDLPDQRDLLLQVVPPKGFKLSAAFDLLDMCPPVYNQLSLGSCTAQAAAALVQFTEKEEVKGKLRPIPSRLLIYYNTRYIQRTVNQDSGASIRNTLKALSQKGYCHEKYWPHKIGEFAKMPSKEAANRAAAHRLTDKQYMRVVQSVLGIKQAVSLINPVIFGFSVYEASIKRAGKTGQMPVPDANESMVGGHAVMIIGWDDSMEAFLVRNSWGKAWGEGGYFWMPYDYVTSRQLASDFWTIVDVPAFAKEEMP